MQRRQTFSSRRRRRRGVAPLEFSLSLPVLLIVMVCVFWLGTAMYKLNEVTVQARNKAWKKRYTQPRSEPFRFDVEGRVEGQSRQRVGVSPLFESFAPASSKHTVMAGAWDHRQLQRFRMNEQQPSWNLVRQLGSSVVRGEMNNALSQFLRDIRQLKFSGSALMALVRNRFPRFAQLEAMMNRVKGLLGEQSQKLNDAKRRARERADRIIGNNRTEIENLQKEVQGLQDEMEDLEKRLKADDKRKKTDPKKLKPEDRKKIEERLKKIPKKIDKKNTRIGELREEIRNANDYLKENP